jgi:acetyltransferase-like isoleucine patch superfamily enzyme
MGGVTVGANALVGAGAVVTKDVAPDEVVAGVPARLLRSGAGPD